MHTHRILFVLTSAERMGSASAPTGSWLEEVAAPYYAFTDARCDVSFASVKGGAAPIDPISKYPENSTASTRRFEADAKAIDALATTAALSAVDPEAYDAILFPGGHGTMADFPSDAFVRSLVEAFYEADKPVAAICHGPACLVRATKANGEPLLKGHRFTCFSNEEETLVGLASSVPFLLESELVALGGKANFALPFTSHVVTDRNLITGQNAASAIPLAEAVIQQLRAHVNLRHAA